MFFKELYQYIRYWLSATLVDADNIYVGNERILGAERESIRSHSVKNYLRKRLQTCHKTGNGIIIIIIIIIIISLNSRLWEATEDTCLSLMRFF